jgi:hypothetical protein
MAPSIHTYGPTCHLASGVAFSGSNGDDDLPPIRPQYFHTSPLPIDDPLTGVPSADPKTIKYPRPFAAYDNNALEEAWLGLCSDNGKKKRRCGDKRPKSQATGKRRESKLRYGVQETGPNLDGPIENADVTRAQGDAASDSHSSKAAKPVGFMTPGETLHWEESHSRFTEQRETKAEKKHVHQEEHHHQEVRIFHGFESQPLLS